MEKENIFSPEVEPQFKFEKLEKLFGKEGFNPEKTFELQEDRDENNEVRELGNYQCFWTEFLNPDTGEAVEGKVYLPNGTEDYEDVLVISPGYRGDFALQEAEYADDFARGKRAMVMLRHNGLRIEGDDVKNFVHCPEKAEYAQKSGQKFLGKNEKFNFEKANREVLTFLKALGSKIDQIKNIDILGHSWGARITLESLVVLHKEDNETAKKIQEKINNAILLGSWFETIPEKAEPYRDFFRGDAEKEYFKQMDGDQVIADIFKMYERLETYKAQDLPENVRLVAINSLADSDVDMEAGGEVYRFFKQFKEHEKIGNLVLKDLAKENLLATHKGGQDGGVEVHDYLLRKPTEQEKARGIELNQVRRWIKKMIETK